jgi:Snf7
MRVGWQVRQYQKRIAVSLDRDRELAKQLLKEGKTERAKLLLRKKKYMESLLDKADNQLDQLGMESAIVGRCVVCGICALSFPYLVDKVDN